jgi:hypothetical protein
MDTADRAAALANLESSRDAFQAGVAGLSEAQARFKPSAERWSVEEIIEHVAIAEHGMYRFISELHETSSDPHTEENAAALARASDRKGMPLVAPERARPKARFGSLQAALKQFLDNRERTIEFVRNCSDDLRLRLVQHPLGLVNGEGCLAILTLHPIRHLEQINELKADPAFPR